MPSLPLSSYCATSAPGFALCASHALSPTSAPFHITQNPFCSRHMRCREAGEASGSGESLRLPPASTHFQVGPFKCEVLSPGRFLPWSPGSHTNRSLTSRLWTWPPPVPGTLGQQVCPSVATPRETRSGGRGVGGQVASGLQGHAAGAALSPLLAGLPSQGVASTAGPGPSAPQQPPFPDIYGGDAQLWEAHFRGIGRAYRALGKEDDFAIRVLTEDFTLPFPFAWPPGPDPARGPLFYDPRDRAGFDFLLRGPGAQPPALLQPLHATAQAAVRKRRLERLALSYAQAGGGSTPGLVLLAPPGPTATAAAAFPGPETGAPRPGYPQLPLPQENE